MTSHPRRDSENSNHSSHSEVFSGDHDHKDAPKSPVSPDATNQDKVKLVPAPAPVVNVWAKRKSETQPSEQPAQVTSPVTSPVHSDDQKDKPSETKSSPVAQVSYVYC